MKNGNNTLDWCDQKGLHPMNEQARNSIGERLAGEVLRVIRNALAHGNVAYLNSAGHEERGAKVQYLGFLSRYEETDEQRKIAETLHSSLLECHVFRWIIRFERNIDLVEAA
jgi:hypothetical protein